MNKNDVRIKILQAGAALMHSKGYNDTGIKEITDAAGIPKGSFYNYFQSKEQFAISALDYMGQQSLVQINSILNDLSKPPLGRITDFYTEMIEINIRQLKFKQGCFIGNLCQEMADVNTAIGEKVDCIFRNYTAALSRCLNEAQRKGDIRGDYDVDQLAEFIFNSWEGALMRVKASRNAQPLTAFMNILTSVLLK